MTAPPPPAGLSARLFEMLAPHPAELRVVPQEVRELAALLNQVAPGEPRDLLVEVRGADELAQDDARVVEAQGLVEVRRDEIMLPVMSAHEALA